jgi:hypothetical protein
VLGIAISLAKEEGPSKEGFGGHPSQVGYSAFTGGLGLLAALVGVAALFIGALDGVFMWALDGLASLCFLAGGIVSLPYSSFENRVYLLRQLDLEISLIYSEFLAPAQVEYVRGLVYEHIT